MKDRLLRLIAAGTENVADLTVKRHVQLSNLIYLSLPVVYVAFMLLDIRKFLSFDINGLFRFDRIVAPVTIIFCFACYGLNRVGWNILGRCLFLVLWPILLHVLPVIIQGSPADYYLAFPLGIVFHSVLIHVAFSHSKEKWLFWPFIAANFSLMLFSSVILESNDPLPESVNVVRTSFYYRIDEIHYWLLFNLLTYYILFVVDDMIEKLNVANATIVEQRDELEEKNTEMEQLINSLALANQTLESRVEERTIELSGKNEKLVQYAYFNAHLLRGPYARVRGLINLMSLNEEYQRDTGIQLHLQQSLDELDGVIRAIQKTVE